MDVNFHLNFCRYVYNGGNQSYIKHMDQEFCQELNSSMYVNFWSNMNMFCIR